CVERKVRVLQIADKIVLNDKMALIGGRYPGQRIHVLEHLAVLVVDDSAAPVAVGQPLDVLPGHLVGDFLDREVEFVAGDEIDSGRVEEALLRLDRNLCSDESDLRLRIDRLDHLRRLRVQLEGGRRGVDDDKLVALHFWEDIVELQPMRRRVDQRRAFAEGGRLGEPGRIPEGAHLARILVARASASIETFKGRGLEEKRAEHKCSYSRASWPPPSMR